MTMSTIAKERIFVVTWTAIWLFLIGFLFIKWHQIPTALAWILAAIEAMFVPDIGKIREVFRKQSNKSG